MDEGSDPQRPFGPPDPGPREADLALPEGVEIGLVGGLAVALAYAARDLWAGSWLHTPSVLGALVVSGLEAAREVGSNPALAAIGHGLHFALWVAFGFALAALASRRYGARVWLAGLGLAMVAALAVVDVVLGTSAYGPLHLWLGALLGAAAVYPFLLWRHPQLLAPGGASDGDAG